MRLLVIGAAGRIGGLCVQRAAAAGHDVFAFARTPAKIAIPAGDRVSHLQGDALVAESVDAAFVTARPDAVITTVGLVRGSPVDMASRVARNVVAATRKHGTRRVITLAGIQVHDAGDGALPFEFRCWGWLFRNVLGLGPGLADAAAMLAWLRSDCADIDWTVARPSLFKDGPPLAADVLRDVSAGPVAEVGRSIRCVDLASWMVAQASVSAGPFKHAAPALSNRL